MRKIEIACIFIHLVVGVGALFGGAAAIINPYSPLGIAAEEALVLSPFTSFLIPGLILFGIIGLGNIFATLAFIRRWSFKSYISGFFACGLIIWIVVQCIMLQVVVALHVIYFFIGVIQGFLALYLLWTAQK